MTLHVRVASEQLGRCQWNIISYITPLIQIEGDSALQGTTSSSTCDTTAVHMAEVCFSVTNIG
jgi:hypothetical protein